jgi:hypothetical protein
LGKCKEDNLTGTALLSSILVIIYKESLLKADVKVKDGIFERMEVIMKGNFEIVLPMASVNFAMDTDINMRVNGRQISLMAVDKRSTRMEADIMVSS